MSSSLRQLHISLHPLYPVPLYPFIMADNSDVQVQLNDLEAEEARIMRELREIDEKTRAESAPAAGTTSGRPQSDAHIDDPESALASLLAECEKEVRDAKGYIADHGPPMRIVRLRKGEVGPKTATYLSRPRNTGVDFTIPVAHKSYSQAVKHPIFLNDIRDKIRSRTYTHPDEYIADMRLLYRNTDTFNKGPDLEWVVQHARLLLEAAEEAVKSRSSGFGSIDRAMRQSSSSKHRPPASASKRKRTSDPPQLDRHAVLSVGTVIEIWWGSTFRRWFPAVIVDRAGPSKALVRYKSDDSTSWVSLHGSSACNWRLPVAKPPTPSPVPQRSSSRRADPPPGKKRRAAPSSPRSSGGAPVVIDTVNGDTDALQAAVASQLKDAVASIKDQFREGLERVESMVHRSDGLQRVLLAVQDTQDTLQASLSKVNKSVEHLRSNLRSVQRDVAELKDSLEFGTRKPRNMRPDTIEYNRIQNEQARRHDRKKDRDNYGEPRKERASGRDYDRDSRRAEPRRGMDHKSKALRMEDRRTKGDWGERPDRRPNSKHNEVARSDEDLMDVDDVTPERKEHSRNSNEAKHARDFVDKAKDRNGHVNEADNDRYQREDGSRPEVDRDKVDDGDSEKESTKARQNERHELEGPPRSPRPMHDSPDDNRTMAIEVKDSPDSGGKQKREERDSNVKVGSPMEDDQDDVGKMENKRRRPLNDSSPKVSPRADKTNVSDSDSESDRGSDSEESDESGGDADADVEKRKESRIEGGKAGRSAGKTSSPKYPDAAADEGDKKYEKKTINKDVGDDFNGNREHDRDGEHDRDRRHDRKNDRGSDRESQRDTDRESDRRRETESDRESNQEKPGNRKHDAGAKRNPDSDSEDEPHQDRICGREGGERRNNKNEERWNDNGSGRGSDEEQRIVRKGTRRGDRGSDGSDDDDKNSQGEDGKRKGASKGIKKATDGGGGREDSSDGSGDRDNSSSDSEDDRKEATTKADMDSGREIKRGSGAGSRPKVSRFAQAPEEGGTNTALNRDGDDIKKVTGSKGTDSGTDKNESDTPEEENGEISTSGKHAKTNGTSK